MAEKNLEAAIRNYRQRLRGAIANAADKDAMSLQAGLIAGLYADIGAMEKHLDRRRSRADALAFYESLDREHSALDGI